MSGDPQPTTLGGGEAQGESRLRGSTDLGVETRTQDLSELEAEARVKARKQVANLLQRPDQLEKVEQIRKRVARKKVSVEAMLKTAVQSQLDGVRTGMNQLQNALQDIRDIKSSLGEIDGTYRSIAHLGDKLKKIREENSRHSQLAAAVENLKHIFNVPEVAKKCQDQINDGKLLNAHKTMTELEMARDDLLFELHKQPTPSPTDKNTVKHYFADVEKLSDSLSKQLWLVLQRSIVTIRREPTVVVTVVRIIEREERVDAMMNKRYDTTGFMAPNRPKRWRMKCFDVLKEAVQARIEGSQMEDRDMNKMWLVKHLEVIRQLVIEDLRVVKTLCESCFPEYYDIVNKYVQMYHQAISHHLNDMVDQGLEGNEIVSLLTWIHSYNTEEFMNHKDLRIDTSEFGPLLESRVISELQNQYIQTLKGNFTEWMANSLSSDKKDWERDQEPDSNDKGFFNTSLPVILFQMIEQNMQVASTINENLALHCLNLCVDELGTFGTTYKDELTRFKDQHMQDRSWPQFFISYMIANINNCETFSEMTLHLREQFTKSEEAHSERSMNRFQRVSQLYNKVADTMCDYLLEEVFLDLNTHLQSLMTRPWMQSTIAVDTVCITIEDYCQDFLHLKDKYYDLVLHKAENRITMEYVRAILSKRIVFKNYEERRPAAEKIIGEAEQLLQLFSRLANKQPDHWTFEALPLMAEVLKLQDTTMVSLELSSLVTKFPSMRSEHLVNLLLVRGDIGRGEAREKVVESIGDDDKPKPHGIFTNIAV